MTPQTVTITQGVVKVVLENDAKSLDEVVVTATNISRERKALGYAVQDVEPDQLTRAVSTDLAGALQGKVSGMDIAPSSGMPGASSKTAIRGSRSFTGGNIPLYVTDGMPISSAAGITTTDSANDAIYGTDYANRSVDIDPNDIESINTLKGRAAFALCGMCASNGTIVVTTKNGKGVARDKPTITSHSNLSFDVVSTLPELQNEFRQDNGDSYDPYSGHSQGPRIADLTDDPTYGSNTDSAFTRKMGKRQGRYYVPQRTEAGLDLWATPKACSNMKDFFDTDVTWSNDINVSQNLDKGNYSFSLGNSRQEGIVPTTGMDRYDAKMSAEVQLSPNWSTGFNGNFVTSKIKKQSTTNSSVTATIYNVPVSYNMKGIPSRVEGDSYEQDAYYRTWVDDTCWAVNNNLFTKYSQRFFGSVFVKFTTGFSTDNHKLDVRYQPGDDTYATNYSEIYGHGSTMADTGNAIGYHYSINELNSLLTASYRWDINKDWVFDALIGSEFIKKRTQYAFSEGMNFSFPGWNRISNASIYQSSKSYNKKRTVGNFANLSLAWKNMIYLSGTTRNNVVPNVPRDNRSFTYPSISLEFVFTEFEPLKNNILVFGKLRASYTEVGMAGDYMQSYYYIPSYGGGFFNDTPITYLIDGTMACIPYYKMCDPSLKPQNTKSYEIGTDLTFFSGLFTLSCTYSRQNIEDQIFGVPLPDSTGYDSMIMNGGKIHTNSHELTLGVSPVNNRNFKLGFAFNFSKIDNYVDGLAPGVKSIYLGRFVTPQMRAGTGEKFPVVYGSIYKRNKAGQIVVDANGLPQVGEDGVIGRVSPDFRLGFNTNIEFYKFRIAAVFDWKQGGQMYRGTADEVSFYGITKESGEERKSNFVVPNTVKETGTDTQDNPAYAANNIEVTNAQAYYTHLRSTNESYIYDSSFIKLRGFSVDYPVCTSKWLGVDVSVSARNLIAWSELKGFNPEASQGNDNIGGAFERFSLPETASYGFSVNVKL